MPSMSKMSKSIFAAAALAAVPSQAVVHKVNDDEQALTSGNPIRKVITLLQKMGKKIATQGKDEEDLYEKFECYCKTTSKELNDEIARLTGPTIVTQPDIDSTEAELGSGNTDVENMKTDRVAAQKSLEDAAANRKKENSKFKELSEAEQATAKAAGEAVELLKRSKGALLLQNAKTVVPVLQKAVSSSLVLADESKTEILSLLAGKTEGPSDGVVGTLSQMKETAEKEFAKLTAREDQALAAFLKIKSSKADEISTLMDQIQRKQARNSELKIQIVDMKHQLKTAADNLEKNQNMLAEVTSGCQEKAKVWTERQQSRAQEQTAVAEAIKVLNGDESLDLFKKTLGKDTALLQIGKTESITKQVLALVNEARTVAKDTVPQLNFLALALSGKAVDFSSVNKMIDEMVGMMVKQADDDETKRDYCEDELNSIGKKQRNLKRDIGDIKASIKDKKASIEALDKQLADLEQSNKDLAKSVETATAQRNKEAAEGKQVIAENTVAIELLRKATNQLNKFYNPQLFVATTTESPYDPYSFVEIKEHNSQAPKPPATFGDVYESNKESSPVIGMIRSLQSDLQQEIKVIKSQEELSIKEYERSLKAADSKKTADQNSIDTKLKAKSDYEEAVSNSRGTQADKDAELTAAANVEKNLHGECDWLQANYDVRKAAREQEMEALKRAKATLAGANLGVN
eukprot:TRINITY_DN63266_c0_g1_i1.p1 TRINITY_DN63266_c0_g1~~TRINITY_DN63266_c0_g1_i1.p1  ORF type:complete len:690 (-),score=241.90 TRINITY_DN63266_c0_g1_i1:155-2224(-)